LVSVVIPTADRSDLVVRAVQSVLSQSYRDLEVIVVIDGPDPGSRAAVSGVSDPRVRSLELDERVGPGAARNAGVAESRGTWIAFLDDDDEWLPERVERQLETARRVAGDARVIVGCVETRGGGHPGSVWPRRLPALDEPLSEYLFARRGPFWGEGLMQTSTWLVDAELLRGLPFRSYPRHEDLDWLLRADRERAARIEFTEGADPIAIWSIDTNRPRASVRVGWRDSVVWARENRELFTPRAYASFLLLQVAADARRQRDWSAVRLLLGEALARGRPRIRDVAIFAGLWLVPRSRSVVAPGAPEGAAHG
jgi:glycosyltransferase involved in cell wall biosynthesis